VRPVLGLIGRGIGWILVIVLAVIGGGVALASGLVIDIGDERTSWPLLGLGILILAAGFGIYTWLARSGRAASAPVTPLVAEGPSPAFEQLEQRTDRWFSSIGILLAIITFVFIYLGLVLLFFFVAFAVDGALGIDVSDPGPGGLIVGLESLGALVVPAAIVAASFRWSIAWFSARFPGWAAYLGFRDRNGQ